MNLLDKGSEDQEIYSLKYPDFETCRHTDMSSRRGSLILEMIFQFPCPCASGNIKDKGNKVYREGFVGEGLNFPIHFHPCLPR